MSIPFDEISKYNRFAADVRKAGDFLLQTDVTKFLQGLSSMSQIQAEREYNRLKERYDRLQKK